MGNASQLRAVVFSELLAPPFDEGFKNLALALIRELGRERQVVGLTSFGADIPEYGIRKVKAGKSLLSSELRRVVRSFAPDDIYYIPTASYTLASFLRAQVLRLYGRNTRVHLIVLQPRHLGPFARALIPHLAPYRVWAQSPNTVSLLTALGQKVGTMPSGVDADRFRPVSSKEKRGLRVEFELTPDAFVVLHVGHIKEKRNVELLARVQELPGCQAVLVGSTSTRQDEALGRRLVAAGVKIIRDYVPRIEQLYQLADCYLFPVLAETGSIEIPLSMLESMACGVPVVTTPYGGMEQQFPASEALRYGNDAAELVLGVQAVQKSRPTGMRELVEPFTWTAVFKRTILATGADTIDKEQT
ncbi:MAG: glycosyltransferase [bacterium]